MTIRRMEPLGLGDLLGSFMGSVVDAQAKAARAVVSFVEEVGFESSPEGDRLRTVSLRYTKRDENDQPSEFVVEVPLLSLVNVPSLVVSKATLSFSYDIVTAQEGAGSETVAASGRSSVLGKLELAKLTGFVRRKGGDSPSASRTTSVEVNVTLEQQDLPVGIERLFDLAELGITEAAAGNDGDQPS